MDGHQSIMSRDFDFYRLESRILLSGEGFDTLDPDPGMDAALLDALLAELPAADGQAANASSTNVVTTALPAQNNDDSLRPSDEEELAASRQRLSGSASIILTANPVVELTSDLAATNRAPVLATEHAAELRSVSEDQRNPDGQSVASFLRDLGDPITDVDAGAVEGIAITSADQANGSWQFSTDGGTTWHDFGLVTDSEALTLDSSALVRFIPASNFDGASSFDFRAWDQTDTSVDGQNGVNTLSAGSDSAFSSASLRANIDVVAVNDAPSWTGLSSAVEYAENGPAVILQPRIAIIDDSPTFESGILRAGISRGLTDGDLLQVLPGNNVTTEGQDVLVNGTVVGSFSGGENGNLLIQWNENATIPNVTEVVRRIAFTSTSDNPTNATRFVTLFVNDDQGGGAFALGLPVVVTPSNDAPVWSQQSAPASNYIENAAPQLLHPDIQLTDVDSADFDNGVLRADFLLGATANDYVSIVPGGEVTTIGSGVYVAGAHVGDFTGGAAGESLVVHFNDNSSPSSVAKVAQRIAYHNDSDHPATNVRIIGLVAQDGDGGTVSTAQSITPVQVNDAPVVDPTSIVQFESISEDDVDNAGQSVSSLLASAGDPITDPDADAIEGIAITLSDSVDGVWQYSTNGGDVWNNVGVTSTQSALLLRESDFLRFVPNGQNGTTAQIEFLAWDQTARVSGDFVDATDTGRTTSLSNDSLTASITVTDVNDSPRISLANTTTAIAEDADLTTPVKVSDIVIADDGIGTNQVLLSGTDASRFEVVGTELFLRSGQQLDFESDRRLDINVAVDDPTLGNQQEDTVTFALAITDVNEHSVSLISDSNTAINRVNENASIGTLAGLSTIATDFDATNNTVTYSLVDTAGDRFAINAQTGVVTVAGDLNHEAFAQHAIQVQATSADGSSSVQTFIIDVVDVNEAPVAVGEQTTTLPSQPVTISAVSNDIDVDGDVITLILTSLPQNGTVSIQDNGTLTYTPDPAFFGTDTFTYQASDGSLTSDDVFVEVTTLSVLGSTTTFGAPSQQPSTQQPSIASNRLENPATTLPSLRAFGGATVAIDATIASSVTIEVEDDSELVQEVSSQPTAVAILAPARRRSVDVVDYERDPQAAFEISSTERSDNDANEMEHEDGQDALIRFDRNHATNANQQLTTEVVMLERLLQLDLEQAIVWQEWDAYRKSTNETHFQYVAGAATACTGIASIGYVVWALRGGAFITTISSSIPAWRMIDPASLLAAYRSVNRIADDEVDRILG